MSQSVYDILIGKTLKHTHPEISGGTGGTLTASNITNIPSGDINSVDLQNTVYELDNKKIPKILENLSSLSSLSGNCLFPVGISGDNIYSSELSNLYDYINSIQITKIIYVDKNRTDSYIADGSIHKPFLTINEATSIATVNSLIKVTHGTYTENVTLPNGVSIEGYASNHTIIDGNLTTTASTNMSIRYIQITGNNTVTLNAPVDFSDCFINGAVIVNNIVTQCYNLHITPSISGVVPLTINGASAKHQHFLSTLSATGDTNCVIVNNGTLIFDVVQCSNSGTNECFISYDGQSIILNSWIINTGGGSAINIDNGANTVLPNAVSNIFAVGNIVCGTANTIIEGKYNITGSLSGTALILRPASLISVDVTNFNNNLSNLDTDVQKALDTLDNKIYNLVPNVTGSAVSGLAGTLRYYVSGDNSYCDICMQSASGTWEWTNIITQSW